MEDSDLNLDRWTGERLDALEPPAAWRPDAARALAQLRRRSRLHRRRIVGAWLGGLAAAAAILMLLMAASAPQACATPASCAQHFWETIFR